MSNQTGVSQLLLFNYSTLDAETTDYLKQNAQATRGLLKRTAEDMLQIGKNLLEAKARLPHGQYIPWVRAELGISQSTAWRLTQVAQGKPVKSFKMNDLLLQIVEPTEDDFLEKEENPERLAQTLQVYQSFFALLREERPDFDQMLTLHANRVAWLQTSGRDPEEDDVLPLLWEEIEQFAGIQTAATSARQQIEREPFDLDTEAERIRILGDQMKTAQSGLFGLMLELGQRLSRVKQFFADEEETAVQREVISQYLPDVVPLALRIGHALLQVSELLNAAQLVDWAQAKLGLQPEQMHTLISYACRYTEGTTIDEIASDDCWMLASTWFAYAQATLERKQGTEAGF